MSELVTKEMIMTQYVIKLLTILTNILVTHLLELDTNMAHDFAV